MNNLRLSIRQTYSQLGITTTNAKVEIESPRGEQSIDQKPAKIEIEAPPGRLTVDSSEAWAALGRGSHLEWMSSIYGQMQGVVMQNISGIVEDGNRMADISNPNDAIADIAYSNFRPKSLLNFQGSPSFTNVRVQFEANDPTINIEPQKADIEFISQKPQIQYTQGNVELYLRQKNSINIYVSEYDLYK
ncbi:DUF6470 family protein [Paenibacillus sp. NPDC056579]|uniref:DUF6470 family protein n=1 Tax=Paenibacillus sp. NPDC056579 TaxID=3345871 RepID=UPI0036863A0F